MLVKMLILMLCFGFAMTGLTAGEEEDNVQQFYTRNTQKEKDRLIQKGRGELEFLRTQSILNRYLPSSPAVILDIGGGTGIHAFPLAKQGHKVHLIDFTAALVEEAQKEGLKDTPLASYSVGDARNVEFTDSFADVVLLFGPMYHLTEHKDRLKALSEAYRVLKPNGIIFVAAISRFAPFMDGFYKQRLQDPAQNRLISRMLETGQHKNLTEDPSYFTTSYFHMPEELQAELAKSGFKNIELKSIEGPLWGQDKINFLLEEDEKCQILMGFLEKLEDEKSIIGASSHIMAIGRKHEKQ